MSLELIEKNIKDTDADILVIPTSKLPALLVSKKSVEGTMRSVFAVKKELLEDNILFKCREKLGKMKFEIPKIVDMEQTPYYKSRKDEDQLSIDECVKKIVFIVTTGDFLSVYNAYVNIFKEILEKRKNDPEFKNLNSIAIPLLGSGNLQLGVDEARVAATTAYNDILKDNNEISVKVYYYKKLNYETIDKDTLSQYIDQIEQYNKQSRDNIGRNYIDEIEAKYKSLSENDKMERCNKDLGGYCEFIYNMQMIKKVEALNKEIKKADKKSQSNKAQHTLDNLFDYIAFTEEYVKENGKIEKVKTAKHNKLCISRKHLAKILGIDNSVLGNYINEYLDGERIERRFKREGIIKLALVYGCDIVEVNEWIKAFSKDTKLLNDGELNDQFTALVALEFEDSKLRDIEVIEKEFKEIKTKSNSIMK